MPEIRAGPDHPSVSDDHADGLAAAVLLRLDARKTLTPEQKSQAAESFGAERRNVRRTWWQQWKRAKRAHAKAAV